MANEKGNSVATRQKWLQEDDDRHELACALRAGVSRMRKLAFQGKYNYPNPGELELVSQPGTLGTLGTALGNLDTIYSRRINRSDLPNPWKESIEDMARLPFRSRIDYQGWDVELVGEEAKSGDGEEVARTPGWVDDVDGRGASLDQYAHERFEDSLFEGIAFSFVDNDPRSFPDVASRQLARARPRVVSLDREDMGRIIWQYGADGLPRLLQIAFKQPEQALDIRDPNAWEEESSVVYKVVTAGDPQAPKLTDAAPWEAQARLVRTQIYRQDDEDEWVEDESRRSFIVPDNPSDELFEIPLVPHYGRRVGPWRGECPFLETAHTQNSIWIMNSEILGLAREAALTHVSWTGAPLDPTTKKPTLPDSRMGRLWISNDPAATLQIHEISGSAVKTIKDLIDWKIGAIRDAHHQIFVDRPDSPVTAREITLQGVHASSFLEMLVIFQERAWQKILELMALLGGLPKRGIVSIPHDFGLPSTAMDRSTTLFLAGKMSPKSYQAERVRAGDVGDDFDQKYEVMWCEDQIERERSLPGNAGAAVESGVP